jgi:hypothetical protein
MRVPQKNLIRYEYRSADIVQCLVKYLKYAKQASIDVDFCHMAPLKGCGGHSLAALSHVRSASGAWFISVAYR